MQNNLNYLIAFFLGVILLYSQGCAQTSSEAGEADPTAANIAEVRAAIEAANADINRQIKAGNFEEAGSYFHENVVQMVAGQPPVGSRADWIAAQQQAGEMGDWDLQLQVLDLEVCGDIAVERGRGIQTFSANDSSPMPSFQMTGDYIVLWKKVDGQWQIHWDYVVTQAPPE